MAREMGAPVGRGRRADLRQALGGEACGGGASPAFLACCLLFDVWGERCRDHAPTPGCRGPSGRPFRAADGLYVRLRLYRTEQEGAGTVRALPSGSAPLTCPPCAFLRWRQILTAFEGCTGTTPDDSTVTLRACRQQSTKTRSTLQKDRPTLGRNPIARVFVKRSAVQCGSQSGSCAVLRSSSMAGALPGADLPPICRPARRSAVSA